jgi:hypothetical protein
MFNGHRMLNLTEGHLDLCFGDPDAWPQMTPKGSLRGYSFDMGDEDAGPEIQLGLISSVEGEVLDWAHSVDPPHFHGSDQFRVIAGGEWELAGRAQPKGGYSFQESGRIYREHPGQGGTAWLVLVMGDRRGAKPTIIREADRQNLIDINNDSFKPAEDEASYPHPAGPSGTTAIATTDGPCDHGYLRGLVADRRRDSAGRQDTLTGLLGDPVCGPAVHAFKSDPDEVVMPTSTYSTERFIVVTGGSCSIGSKQYSAGDLRIQASGASMPEVKSGSQGVEVAMLVADRRGHPEEVETEPMASWSRDVHRLLEDLNPLPGGV